MCQKKIKYGGSGGSACQKLPLAEYPPPPVHKPHPCTLQAYHSPILSHIPILHLSILERTIFSHSQHQCHSCTHSLSFLPSLSHSHQVPMPSQGAKVYIISITTIHSLFLIIPSNLLQLFILITFTIHSAHNTGNIQVIHFNAWILCVWLLFHIQVTIKQYFALHKEEYLFCSMPLSPAGVRAGQLLE